MERTHKQRCAGIALGVLLACSACAFALDPSLDASQYAHTAWKIGEGFATGSIQDIAQTSDGYLWLATEAGLLRFDGVRTLPWQPPRGEHLPSIDIRALIVASDGTLWLGTAKGLVSWKDGKLAHYPELDGSDVASLLQDRQGTIWAAGVVWEGGLSQPGKLCAIRVGAIECYGDDGAFSFGVTALYEDSRGNLWLGAGNGLWRWRPGPPDHYALAERKHSALAGLIFNHKALIEGEHGNLLVAGLGGIKELIDGKLKEYPHRSLHFNEGGTLLRDRNGGLWIGTLDRGILHVHQGRTDVFAQSDGLSSNAVKSLFEDREGNIWVSTTAGLDLFREYAIPTISVKQGLSSPLVVCVLAARDGSVWLGTSDGLNRWKDAQLTIYRKRSGATGSGAMPVEPAAAKETSAIVQQIALPGNYIDSLFQDAQGRIWVSAHEGIGYDGLGYFENGRFTRFIAPRLSFVIPINGDSSGNIRTTSSDGGLCRFRVDKPVDCIPWAKLGLRGAFSDSLVIDPAGGVWLGFWNGGVVYFKDGAVRASYGRANGLGGGRVNALKLDPDGTLWAATDGGLSRIKDGRVATLTSKNGLPCDTIHDLIDDDTDSSWLYTACGLARVARSELAAWAVDPQRRVQAKVFDSSDGIRSHAGVYYPAPRVAKTADGRLWFLPLNGVSVVDPHRLPFNHLPPPVHVEQVIADGKTYDVANGLRLPPNVRDLEIYYTALSLVAPEKVRFRFKLEGQDEEWREVNRRRVEYSNLPPGNYRFRVIACNNSGVWNQDGASLDFSIAPAYYQTNGFRTLCTLSFLATLWTVYRLRVHALERRHALLEQHRTLLEQHQTEIRALNEEMVTAQEAERIRIAGELHDGVLQQITSLTLRLAKVRNQVPADSEAKSTVSGLQQQLIQIGTDIRHISHELHPALLQEAGLPAALSAYCREFATVRGLSVTCETDENVKELSPGAALCLYRIAQEALGNAAKHSEAKKVEVRLTRSDNRVCLSVSDDGVGCPPDHIAKSGGLGVINMRERVLQLDGTFEFVSRPGRGTRVKVEIPFRPAF